MPPAINAVTLVRAKGGTKQAEEKQEKYRAGGRGICEQLGKAEKL